MDKSDRQMSRYDRDEATTLTRGTRQQRLWKLSDLCSKYADLKARETVYWLKIDQLDEARAAAARSEANRERTNYIAEIAWRERRS